MRRNIFQIRLLLVLALFSIVPVDAARALTLPGGTTSNTTGRADFRGYMTNLFKNGANDAGALFNVGLVNKNGTPVATAADFIAYYQRALFRNNPDGDPDQAEAAAAYTVAFMVHGPNTTQFFGPDNDPTNYQRGLQFAKDHFAEWSNLINIYDKANTDNLGWGVKFHVTDTLCHPLYQGNLDYQSHDVFFYEQNDNSCDNEDVVEFVNPPDAAGKQTYFFLLMVCGNPYGSITKLTGGDFTTSVSIAPEKTTVRPGETINVQVAVHNNSPSVAAPVGTMEVYRIGGQMDVPCAPGNCLLAPPAQTDLDDGGYKVSSVHGFRPNANIVGESGQNWYWSTNSLPGATNATGSFQMTVSAGANNSFPLKVCFTPADSFGGKICESVVITVAKVRTPTVIGQNGDIYGGGHVAVNGTCTQLGTAVDVRANAGSYGDYIVAASGNISASPSSNGSGGGTTLKLGSSGGYAEICRPDLLASALAYSGTTGVIAGPNFDVTGKSGVWVYSGGGTLTISGTIQQKLTIVVPSANVLFNSNVRVDPALATSARTSPSMGLITKNDILISSAVTQIDGFLFSSTGTINTCLQANTSCSNVLTVNGFLMASDITFGRLGALNTSGAQLAERIVLTPQLYLNPPTLFDGIATNVTLNGQGEKQPLY